MDRGLCVAGFRLEFTWVSKPKLFPPATQQYDYAPLGGCGPALSFLSIGGGVEEAVGVVQLSVTLRNEVVPKRPAFGIPDHREILDSMLLMGPEVPAGRREDIPALNRDVTICSRIFEICVACVALLVALPIMCIVAIAIKLGTPGPLLFCQTRHGLNGEPFRFVKFRTFFVDARDRFPELYAYKYDNNEIRSIQFKQADDPRITPQGRWLRKTSLDELPNLFLVLTGKLALVGPRPQIPEMLPYYKWIMLERYSVRPGLTDLAHVSGRNNLSFYQTTAMDIAYVRAQSWKLDLKILWKTVTTLILRDGAF